MSGNKGCLPKYKIFVAKLDLFKNVEVEYLVELLKSVHIVQYQKQETVSFNSRKHSNLYINYEGLLKLTKIDESGDEVVMSIINKGGVVSPMYFSAHYDVCADFVKKTTMLSFPKDAVNKLLGKSHQFSLNTIKFLANNVQELMLTSELLQLKTAKEKVGWYLAHVKINHSLELPFSKSLIASYLGMKPESFSRALAELKKEGVQLEDKKILLKQGNELCRYCNKVVGSDCTLFNSERCIHNQYYKKYQKKSKQS